MDKDARPAYNVSMQHPAQIASRSALPRHKPALLSLFILALLYVGALLAMPPEGLTEHDTGAKYLQVRNLRLTPSGPDWSINYPARALDTNLNFVPFRARQYYVQSGRIYLQWPIFLGLLTRIPWKALGYWGLYLVPLLAGLGAAWATYLLALAAGVSRRLGWLAVPLLGLGTPVSIYSLLFFEHTIATMLVALSLLAGLNAIRRRGEATPTPGAGWLARLRSVFKRGRRRDVALSAALLAMAIYFRSELYLLAGVVFLVALFIARREVAWRPALRLWLATFIVMLLPLWLFYAVSEGTLLPLHAIWYFTSGDTAGGNLPSTGLELPAIRYLSTAGWRVVPDFLFGPQGAASSPPLSMWLEYAGLVGLALCALPGLWRLSAKVLPVVRAIKVPPLWSVGAVCIGLLLVLLPSAAALLQGQTYYNLHGFLLASPFVALALWPMTSDLGGEARASAARPVSPQAWLQAVTLLHIGLHVLVISALSGLGPISRHEWGQRYLLPAYPGLIVLSLLAASRIWATYRLRTAARQKGTLRAASLALVSLAALSCLVGIALSVRGYIATYTERVQVVDWQQLARTLPAREPLVTDLWWLPLNLAPDFYSRPIMLAEGDSRLSAWVQQMHSEGVAGFGLMTNNPAVFTGAWLESVPGLRAEAAQPQEANGMWLQRYMLPGH